MPEDPPQTSGKPSSNSPQKSRFRPVRGSPRSGRYRPSAFCIPIRPRERVCKRCVRRSAPEPNASGRFQSRGFRSTSCFRQCVRLPHREPAAALPECWWRPKRRISSPVITENGRRRFHRGHRLLGRSRYLDLRELFEAQVFKSVRIVRGGTGRGRRIGRHQRKPSHHNRREQKRRDETEAGGPPWTAANVFA